MNNIPSEQLTLSAQDFPLFIAPADTSLASQFLCQYLYQILIEVLDKEKQYIVLPSLSVLADFFKQPYLSVYDAMQELRGYGYDYNLSSLDSSIMIWKSD